MSRDPVRLRESISEASPTLRALLRSADDDAPTSEQLASLERGLDAVTVTGGVAALPKIAELRPRSRSWVRPVVFGATAVAALAAGVVLWIHREPKPVVARAVVATSHAATPTVDDAPPTLVPLAAGVEQETTVVITTQPAGGTIFVDEMSVSSRNGAKITAPVGAIKQIRCVAPGRMAGLGQVTWTEHDQRVRCVMQPKASKTRLTESLVVEEKLPLSTESVYREVMADYMPDLQRCYGEYAKTDPAAHGTLTLSFTVTKNGHAGSSKAEGIAPALAACVASRMKSWRFALPSGTPDGPAGDEFRMGVWLGPAAEAKPAVAAVDRALAKRQADFEKAQQLYIDKNFAAAAAGFGALVEDGSPPSNGILYNVAASYEMLGKHDGNAAALGKAVDYYQRYLALSPQAPDADKVTARIAKLKLKIAELAKPVVQQTVP